jgi:hypothetical protein
MLKKLIVYSTGHPRRPCKWVQRASDTCVFEDDVEHKLLEFFDPVISHGFKSIVACALVGDVRLNFYTVLDEAS